MIRQTESRILCGNRTPPYPWPTRQDGPRAGRTDPMTRAHPAYPELPGQDLVAAGIADLARGVESVPALLASIGAPRLESLGVSLPSVLPNAEHRLYELLRRDDPDAAHSRYNALVRRLVSYERALA